MIQALGRGMTPLFIVDWITDKRLHLKLDHAHPVGAAHHQKIVVIDDALAFCGGIDTTADRGTHPSTSTTIRYARNQVDAHTAPGMTRPLPPLTATPHAPSQTWLASDGSGGQE